MNSGQNSTIPSPRSTTPKKSSTGEQTPKESISISSINLAALKTFTKGSIAKIKKDFKCTEGICFQFRENDFVQVNQLNANNTCNVSLLTNVKYNGSVSLDVLEKVDVPFFYHQTTPGSSTSLFTLLNSPDAFPDEIYSTINVSRKSRRESGTPAETKNETVELPRLNPLEEPKIKLSANGPKSVRVKKVTGPVMPLFQKEDGGIIISPNRASLSTLRRSRSLENLIDELASTNMSSVTDVLSSPVINIQNRAIDTGLSKKLDTKPSSSKVLERTKLFEQVAAQRTNSKKELLEKPSLIEKNKKERDSVDSNNSTTFSDTSPSNEAPLTVNSIEGLRSRANSSSNLSTSPASSSPEPGMRDKIFKMKKMQAARCIIKAFRSRLAYTKLLKFVKTHESLKQQRKRIIIIKELLDTERNYVGALQIFIQFYVQPLKPSSMKEKEGKDKEAVLLTSSSSLSLGALSGTNSSHSSLGQALNSARSTTSEGRKSSHLLQVIGAAIPSAAKESLSRNFSAFIHSKEGTRDILDEKTYFNLFRNIESIFSMNSFLLEGLEKTAKDPLERRIGKVMVQFTPFLKLYVEFINYYNKSLDQIQTLLQSNKKFRNYLSNVITDIQQYVSSSEPSLCHMFAQFQGNLDYFLILPIQRIPRYKLLLGELLKNTTPVHKDYDNIELAFKMISETGDQINTEKRRNDDKDLLLNIIPKQHTKVLFKPNRNYIRHSLVKVKEIRLIEQKRSSGSSSPPLSTPQTRSLMTSLYSSSLSYLVPSSTEQKVFDAHAFLFTDLIYIKENITPSGPSPNKKEPVALPVGARDFFLFFNFSHSLVKSNPNENEQTISLDVIQDGCDKRFFITFSKFEECNQWEQYLSKSIYKAANSKPNPPVTITAKDELIANARKRIRSYFVFKKIQEEQQQLDQEEAEIQANEPKLKQQIENIEQQIKKLQEQLVKLKQDYNSMKDSGVHKTSKRSQLKKEYDSIYKQLEEKDKKILMACAGTNAPTEDLIIEQYMDQFNLVFGNNPVHIEFHDSDEHHSNTK